MQSKPTHGSRIAASFLTTFYRCLYRDLLGKANQFVARHASEVYLMVAGIPMRVKGD